MLRSLYYSILHQEDYYLLRFRHSYLEMVGVMEVVEVVEVGVDYVDDLEKDYYHYRHHHHHHRRHLVTLLVSYYFWSDI